MTPSFAIREIRVIRGFPLLLLLALSLQLSAFLPAATPIKDLTFQSDANAGGHAITNLAPGAASNSAATLGQVSGATNALWQDFLVSLGAATNSTFTLSTNTVIGILQPQIDATTNRVFALEGRSNAWNAAEALGWDATNRVWNLEQLTNGYNAAVLLGINTTNRVFALEGATNNLQSQISALYASNMVSVSGIAALVLGTNALQVQVTDLYVSNAMHQSLLDGLTSRTNAWEAKADVTITNSLASTNGSYPFMSVGNAGAANVSSNLVGGAFPHIQSLGTLTNDASYTNSISVAAPGSWISFTLGAFTNTVALSQPSVTTNSIPLTLQVSSLTNGPNAISWVGQGSNVLFPGGVIPTLTSTNATDLLDFRWNGSAWVLVNATFDVK